MVGLLLTWLGNSQELRYRTTGHLAVTEGTHHQHRVIGPCVECADVVWWFVFGVASDYLGGWYPWWVWGGARPATSVCRTQIPWGIWQVSPVLVRGHIMGRRAQKGAHGTPERVLGRHWGAQRGMKAQHRRGLTEGSPRVMETWQEKGALSRGPWGVRVQEEVPSGLGRGSWPRVQRLRCW